MCEVLRKLFDSISQLPCCTPLLDSGGRFHGRLQDARFLGVVARRPWPPWDGPRGAAAAADRHPPAPRGPPPCASCEFVRSGGSGRWGGGRRGGPRGVARVRAACAACARGGLRLLQRRRWRRRRVRGHAGHGSMGQVRGRVGGVVGLVLGAAVGCLPCGGWGLRVGPFAAFSRASRRD